VPKDYPCEIGGSVYECCVPDRVAAFEKAGFTNVRIAEDLSIKVDL
jgi:hypothetical protein